MDKHLNREDRFYIAKLYQAGESIRVIARSIGQLPSTIFNNLTIQGFLKILNNFM